MLDLTHSLLRLSVVYATYDDTVRYPSLALGLLASTLLGCSLSSATPSSSLIPAQLNQNSLTAIPIAHAVRPLPFTGRLTQGDPDELPPSVAASLSANSPLTFVYREQLTHDEYHVPLAVSAFDPVTYVGAPLGDYGVTAFANLTITRGDAVLGDYQAKAYVSKSYNLYAEPTHRELEDAARRAVRAKLDAQLARDAPRLAKAAHEADASAIAPSLN
jgi:hypothetical protein